jgi:hypothetical protein
MIHVLVGAVKSLKTVADPNTDHIGIKINLLKYSL